MAKFETTLAKHLWYWATFIIYLSGHTAGGGRCIEINTFLTELYKINKKSFTFYDPIWQMTLQFCLIHFLMLLMLLLLPWREKRIQSFSFDPFSSEFLHSLINSRATVQYNYRQFDSTQVMDNRKNFNDDDVANAGC